jgi:hypothetical protein
MGRAGIVRWVNIEGAGDGLDGVGQMASADQILEAARAL